MTVTSRYQMLLQLDGHRDRITLNLEVETGVDCQALSEAVVKRCQDVFKLKMDKMEFVSQGTLTENCEKFMDRRWS